MRYYDTFWHMLSCCWQCIVTIVKHGCISVLNETNCIAAGKTAKLDENVSTSSLLKPLERSKTICTTLKHRWLFWANNVNEFDKEVIVLHKVTAHMYVA